MGTVVSFDVAAPFAGDALAAAVRWLHWVDSVFSTYRADSCVSRLGRGEIAVGDCPPEVAEVLAACETLRVASGGYFSAWYAGALDPSGYVKGWAIERAAAMLTAAGSASHCVNGGGDVRCAGARRAVPDGADPPPEAAALAPWRVGIADPLRRGVLCAVVTGQDIAVATSGVAERGAHIIDPVRGEPATGLLSVTVVGPDLALADAYATACVAMGWPPAVDWLAGLSGYEGFGIRADGSTWETAGFGVYRWAGLFAASGRGQVRREAVRRAGVQRRVADQRAVPQDAIGHVDEDVQVGGPGQLAPVTGAGQQRAQRRAPLCGEVLEDLGHVLVLLSGRGKLAKHAQRAGVLEAREAVPDERGEVGGERAGVPDRDDRSGVARHGRRDDSALARPPAVDGLPADPGGRGDRVDREALGTVAPEQLERAVQDRLPGRFVAAAPGVRSARGYGHAVQHNI